MIQAPLTATVGAISLAQLGSVLGTSITAFVATNLDDILILMLFFAQVNQQLRPRQIWIGQYLGFGALILASLPGFLGGYFIPRPWLGLLGVLPIAIGLSHLFQNEESMPQTIAPLEHKSHFFLAPQVYQVAAVTIANGGDNIGIYVPLFANSTLVNLLVTLIVFFVMVAVWCAIAQALNRHPAIARLLVHYGDRIFPFVLIGLGIYILIEGKTHQLLGTR